MNETQINIAQDELSEWLKEHGGLSGEPEFLLGMKEEELEDRIFFAFRYKKSAGGEWLLGVAGGFEDEDDLECPIAFGENFECPDDRDDQASVALYLAIFTLQKQKAQDELCHYLSTREEMNNEEPEEIEYRFVIRGERIDNRIFFAFRFKKPDDDNWYIGVSGGYEDEESLERPLPFSGFDEFPEDKNKAIGYAFAIAEFILKTASGRARNSIEDAVAQNMKYITSPADPEKIAGQFVMTQSRYFLTIGVVDVPSGRVIVSDPLVYLPGNRGTAPILEKEIPKGTYRVEIAILRSRKIGIRVCTARMKIKETPAVRYELAIPTKETAEPSSNEDGVVCGFTVDAGLISFIDADGAAAYRKVDKEWWDSHPGGNRYDDYFKELFEKSYELLPDFQREGGDFIQWINPENNERMVMVSSGLGDGYYLCFWGYDEDGDICELTVPMLDPDIFEDPDDYDDDEYDEDDDDEDDDDDDDDEDDLNTRWQDAYRANPHAYEMEDGGLLVNFALTEDTDSLFPLIPEEHWQMEGKKINKWILSIVSITKDGVLGTIEYHEAIKRLERHFLAEKDGWALIGGLDLDELEELFDGLPRNALAAPTASVEALNNEDKIIVDIFGVKREVRVICTGDNQFGANGKYKPDGFALSEKEIAVLNDFLKNVKIENFRTEITEYFNERYEEDGEDPISEEMLPSLIRINDIAVNVCEGDDDDQPEIAFMGACHCDQEGGICIGFRNGKLVGIEQYDWLL